MIDSETPSLWEIRRVADRPTAIAILVIALIHTSRLINLERGLTEDQISEIANDIFEEYGFMKPEEVKYVLKRALRTEKIYGRLDYNIIMGWFRTYCDERAEISLKLSENEDAREYNGAYQPPAGAMSYAEYVEDLQRQAQDGNEEAKDKLSHLCNPKEIVKDVKRLDDNEKEIAFKEYKHAYLLERLRRENKTEQ